MNHLDLSDDDVTAYLLRDPDYFRRQSHVLGNLRVYSAHQDGKLVSLAERQTELMREQVANLSKRADQAVADRTHAEVEGQNYAEKAQGVIDELAGRIQSFVDNSRANDHTINRILAWVKDIFLTTDASVVPDAITLGIQAHFSDTADLQASMRVWQLAPQYAELPVARLTTEALRSFASSLTKPICRTKAEYEAVAWLEDPRLAQSIALVPLRVGNTPQAFGLLILASADPLRFQEDMATDLLEQIGQIASAALERVRR
jgi:uncharacterized protein